MLATEQVTQSYFFHTDHLGSISVVTDQNGAVVQRLSYDAWGKTRLLNGNDGQPPPPARPRAASPARRKSRQRARSPQRPGLRPDVRAHDQRRPDGAGPARSAGLEPLLLCRQRPADLYGSERLLLAVELLPQLGNFFSSIFSNSVLRSLAQIGDRGAPERARRADLGIAAAAAITAAVVTGMSGGNLGHISKPAVSRARRRSHSM